MPELTDFADIPFTNNHCFHYASKTRLEAELGRVRWRLIPNAG
jgi:hypothetical protein